MLTFRWSHGRCCDPRAFGGQCCEKADTGCSDSKDNKVTGRIFDDHSAGSGLAFGEVVRGINHIYTRR